MTKVTEPEKKPSECIWIGSVGGIDVQAQSRCISVAASTSLRGKDDVGHAGQAIYFTPETAAALSGLLALAVERHAAEYGR